MRAFYGHERHKHSTQNDNSVADLKISDEGRKSPSFENGGGGGLETKHRLLSSNYVYGNTLFQFFHSIQSEALRLLRKILYVPPIL